MSVTMSITLFPSSKSSLVGCNSRSGRFRHFDRAAVGLYDAGEQLQEGRFAAAVVPDDTQFVIPGEVVVETVEDHQIPETLAELFGFEYLGTDARSLNVELQRRCVRVLFSLASSS